MIWRMVYDSKLRSAAEFRREFLSGGPTSTVAAWRYQGKLRKLVSQPTEKLTGNVEFNVMELTVRGGSKVDVSVFVQRRYNRRGLIRLQRTPNLSREGVGALFDNVLGTNSVVFAETWEDYECLVSDRYVLKAASRSNLIRTDRTCDELKRFFQQNHRGGISQGSIDDYLNEFVFRFNARRSARPGYIFRTLLTNAVRKGNV